MGSCASASLLEGRVLIYYEGHQKLLQTDNYSYQELREIVYKLEIDPSSNLLSLTDAGNPILINSEETWSNLKTAKKTGMIVIIICPKQSINTFEIAPTMDSRTDKEFLLVKKNLDSLTEAVKVFDSNLLAFNKAMAFLNVGKCTLQSTILILMVILTPFISEISPKKPYILVKQESRERIPSDLAALFFKWEILVEDMREIEYLVDIASNNIDVLIDKHLKQSSTVSKGLKLNFVALKKADNKIRLINVREQFKRFVSRFEVFTEAVKKSIESYSDERHKIITRITSSLQRAKVQDPYDIAYFFSRSASANHSYIRT